MSDLLDSSRYPLKYALRVFSDNLLRSICIFSRRRVYPPVVGALYIPVPATPPTRKQGAPIPYNDSFIQEARLLQRWVPRVFSCGGCVLRAIREGSGGTYRKTCRATTFFGTIDKHQYLLYSCTPISVISVKNILFVLPGLLARVPFVLCGAQSAYGIGAIEPAYGVHRSTSL